MYAALNATLLIFGALAAVHGISLVLGATKTLKYQAVMAIGTSSKQPEKQINRRAAVAMISGAVELAVALAAFAWAGLLMQLHQPTVIIVVTGALLLLVILLLEGIAQLKAHPVR